MRNLSQARIAHVLFPILSHLPTHLVRARAFGVQQITLILCMMVGRRERSGYRSSLFDAWRLFGKRWRWKRRPSASSLAEARRKPAVLEGMRVAETTIAEQVAALGPPRCQRHPSGRRLIGVDGCRLRLEPTESIVERFGKRQSTTEETYHAEALMVSAWDLLGQRPVDRVTLPTDGSEREAIRAMYQEGGKLDGGDILVADRGFPSREILDELLDLRRDFIIRIAAGEHRKWREVERFFRNRRGGRDQWVTLQTGNRTRKIRLVRKTFIVGRGSKRRESTVVLVTSLANNDWSRADLMEAYRHRWAIEVQFREMKDIFASEGFHARFADGIEQELIAYHIVQMVTAILVAKTLQTAVPGDTWNDPKRSWINRRMALKIAWVILEASITQSKTRFVKTIATMLAELLREVSKRRPGRSFPLVRRMPVSKWHACWRNRVAA